MKGLAGGAAALFATLVAPSFLDARLTRETNTYAPGGRLQRAADPVDCKVQVDRATEKMMGVEGYSITDRAIYILATPDLGVVETGYLVEVLEGPFTGSVFRLASPIDRDPAAAYWLCRAVEDKHG